jgi:hypothetical protein
MGKNNTRTCIETIGFRCPLDGNLQAPVAHPLTNILLDNMVVEADGRES